MQTRRLWRRAAALAGGIAVGFVFVSAPRQTPYDAPTTLTRLYHYDGPSGCEGATSQVVVLVIVGIVVIDTPPRAPYR